MQEYIGASVDESTEVAGRYFAPAVEYFDEGKVDRAYIRRDVEAYHKRWPQQSQQLDGDPKVTLAADGKDFSYPLLEGSVGPDVVDIRKMYAQTGKFTYDPGFTSTASCQSARGAVDQEEANEVLVAERHRPSRLAHRLDRLRGRIPELHEGTSNQEP